MLCGISSKLCDHVARVDFRHPVEPALSPVHASNNVETTFDFVEATFDFIAFANVASTLSLVWAVFQATEHSLYP